MDAEQIWRSKTDEDVVTAARGLSDYEEEGQRLIRAELERRGLTAESPIVPPVSPVPSGIGGWLLLPGIGLVVSCVLGFIGLAQMLSLGADAFAAGLGGMIAVLLVLEAGLLAFTVFATVRFAGRKRNAPRIVIGVFAARVAVYGLLLVVAALGTREILAGAGTDFGRALFYACIWIPYFSVSKRVKATFVN